MIEFINQWHGRTVRGVLLAALAALAGCTSTTVDEFRQGETGITSDEAVVILGRRQASDYETRSEFVQCVGDRMARGEGAINVVPEQEFVDAMFPWFEPRTAPLRTRDLEQLMAENVVAEKMSEFGIRYIVWLDGDTDKVAGGGSMSCAAGPGGGGCFGFAWWQNDANYDASVWDLSGLEDAGTVSADVSGTSFLPAIVIPIPLIARTQSKACNALADQLKLFIVADGPA